LTSLKRYAIISKIALFYTKRTQLTVFLPRHPLRLNVGFLNHSPIGTFREIHFNYPVIKLEDDLEVSDFDGTVRISRTPQGLLVQGNFEGKITVECVRCLAEFLHPLHTEFDELYAFTERTMTESELLIPEDANLEFSPLVREYFLLEIPINPQCRPDCKGLCLECGVNLNLTTCEHIVRQE
jgi:uncharacterized protein